MGFFNLFGSGKSKGTRTSQSGTKFIDAAVRRSDGMKRVIIQVPGQKPAVGHVRKKKQ